MKNFKNKVAVITTQQTHDLLEETNLNFIGNIEGKELIKGHTDVVLCSYG